MIQIGSFILYGLMVLIVVLSIGKWRNLSDFISKIGIKKTDFKRELPIAAMYLAVLLIVSIAVEIAMSYLGFSADLKSMNSYLRGLDLGQVLIVLTIGSFVEEVFFRGYLQRKTNLLFATFVFSYFHIIYGSLSELVGTFFLGLVLGTEYKKTNNLVAPILSHFFFNLVTVAILFGL